MEDRTANHEESGWDCGWEEHQRRQLIRMSKLTLAQKIQWLEDIQIIFEKLSKARKKATDAGNPATKDPS